MTRQEVRCCRRIEPPNVKLLAHGGKATKVRGMKHAVTLMGVVGIMVAGVAGASTPPAWTNLRVYAVSPSCFEFKFMSAIGVADTI